MNYGFEIKLSCSVGEAEEKIREELKKEGFGQVSRINMQEKFKEKLGIEYREYIILGFCNPPAAYEAVEAESNIGLLLPCNVAVYSSGEQTVVSVIRPTVAMSVVRNDSLKSAAEQIETRLKAAVDRL